MNLKQIALSLLVSFALAPQAQVHATPIDTISNTNLETRQGAICPSILYSNPLCCAFDVERLVAADCRGPGTVSSTTEFRQRCSDAGLQARCCAIPAADLGLLCVAPSGA
ncbi:fungal hydrophobin-domain-containing protein [Aspergillus multicolor]|uniref:fungal hydrophobin-domain-containing protein n=1 Tax=Aspergillus multicolor TaxID=41759 RepID=UPI003CCD2CF9